VAVVTAVTILGIGMLTQASTVNNSTSTANNPSSANTTQTDVVVMACYANGEGVPAHIPFEVLASSSSANAPEVESRSNCAQALADLLSAGFAIVDVQPSPVNGAGAYYTLVRNMPNQAGNPGRNSTVDEEASANAVAIARAFLLSKLPLFGIQLENQLQLHTDKVVAETESEYTVEFFVIDQDGGSHKGRVEISNGEVMFADMDDRSIL
jgi:hypothetical protein